MTILSDRVLSIINWIQAGYAVWQFVRVAKFFKLPYAFTSSLWNNGFSATSPKSRKVLLMTFDASEVDGFDQVDDTELEDCLVKTYGFSTPHENLHFKVDGARYDLLLTTQPCNVLQLWLYYRRQHPTVSDKAYLARNCFYFRAKTTEECIDHILAGGYFCLRDYTCIIDQSSTDVLNQNFLRILSIGPLMLQARNLGFASAVFSGFLVLFDIFNYYANQVWKFAKETLIVGIKYFFNIFPRGVRLECIGILSSATDKFRYSDDSRNQTYKKKLLKFVVDFQQSTFVPEGCEVRALYEGGMVPQSYCDALPGTTGKMSFSISGQEVVVEHEFCLNKWNFPVCNLVVRGANGREVKRSEDARIVVYQVHKFLSELEEAKLYPVASCRGSKLTVCNPVEMIENKKFKAASVVHLIKPSVFTIT